MNLKFHIANSQRRFVIKVAMDFGRGAVMAGDYMPVSQTAWAQRFPNAAETFEFEPQAQYALKDFKEGLAKYWDGCFRRAREFVC